MGESWYTTASAPSKTNRYDDSTTGLRSLDDLAVSDSKRLLSLTLARKIADTTPTVHVIETIYMCKYTYAFANKLPIATFEGGDVRAYYSSTAGRGTRQAQSSECVHTCISSSILGFINVQRTSVP